MQVQCFIMNGALLPGHILKAVPGPWSMHVASYLRLCIMRWPTHCSALWTSSQCSRCRTSSWKLCCLKLDITWPTCRSWLLRNAAEFFGGFFLECAVSSTTTSAITASPEPPVFSHLNRLHGMMFLTSMYPNYLNISFFVSLFLIFCLVWNKL